MTIVKQPHTPRQLLRSLRRFPLMVLAVVGPLGMIAPPPAQAQQNAPAASASQKPLSAVLARLTREAGVTVVADSSLAGVPVAVPPSATTPQNLEEQIAGLVKTLPEGTTWAKLYLPPPSGRKSYSGDDIAAYALAQAKLFGTIGETTAPGEVEILGRRIPSSRAEAYVAELNLKPVYLVTNPRARTSNSFGLMSDPTQWQAMSPEQQQQAVDNAARQMANMDPESRQQLIQQNFRIFASMMRLLPPDQRQMQFFLPPGQDNITGSIRVIEKRVPGPENP